MTKLKSLSQNPERGLARPGNVAPDTSSGTGSKSLPKRSQVTPGDCWDLSSLFVSDESWERAFAKWKGQVTRYAEFRGKLGQSARSLAHCLTFDAQFEIAREKGSGHMRSSRRPRTWPTARISG